MNFFFEDYPKTVNVCGVEVPVVTDFREYIKLFAMLKDESLKGYEKICYISQYFLAEISDLESAIYALNDFVKMSDARPRQRESSGQGGSKSLFSFEYDFPFIFSAFLHDYGINLRTVKYMHWWEFRMLFDGLAEENEIKKRMMYRGIDLKTINDKDERKRISKIQNCIRLPDDVLTDYEIGDVFA